jgi:hypothetical protein
VDRVNFRPEVSIQTAVVAYAIGKGLLAIKQGGGGRFGRSGWPDYLFVLPNKKVFWVEFKEPTKGVTSEIQQQRHLALERLKHTVYLICSVETGKYIIDKERGVR